MGTVGRITLTGRVTTRQRQAIQREIQGTLTEVNALFSKWDPESELSRFNAKRTTDPVPVSDAFAALTTVALSHSEKTNGAFDPTVKPLVDYWGFGPERSPGELKEIRQAVGWHLLRVEEGRIIRTHPRTELDFSALAKGYGVDRIADILRQRNPRGFLVELGGDLVAEGVSPSGKPWRIGIETPRLEQNDGGLLIRIIEHAGGALATSGDYRNVRVREDGSRYSHLIDPASGHPAESRVASVTVLAERCTDADAVATALCVMDPDQGMVWIEQNPGYEALWILHEPDGGISVRTSSGFPNEAR